MTNFIDANVIIRAFTENSDKHNCREFLTKFFVTDALCIVEGQHGISKITKDKTYAAACVKSLYKLSCRIIDLDKNLLFETLKRNEKYELSTFDLIHYTAALIDNCSEFVSYDKDFDDLEIKRVEP